MSRSALISYGLVLVTALAALATGECPGRNDKLIAGIRKGENSGVDYHEVFRAAEELALLEIGAGAKERQRKDLIAAIRALSRKSEFYSTQRFVELVGSMNEAAIPDIMATLEAEKRLSDQEFKVFLYGLVRIPGARKKVIPKLRQMLTDASSPLRKGLLELALVRLGDESEQNMKAVVSNLNDSPIVFELLVAITRMGPFETKTSQIQDELRKTIRAATIDGKDRKLDIPLLELAWLPQALLSMNIDTAALSPDLLSSLADKSIESNNPAAAHFLMLLARVQCSKGKGSDAIKRLSANWSKIFKAGSVFSHTEEIVYINMDECICSVLASQLTTARGEEAEIIACLMECAGLKCRSGVDRLGRFIGTERKGERCVLAAKVIGRIASTKQLSVIDQLISSHKAEVRDELQKARDNVDTATAQSPFYGVLKRTK
ncbi:MAG TPA: hypothetical protein VFE62_22150 [Gemmataceae bacterium]|nr:hypothetical protein [Gemmataceae bacterium]